MTDTIIISNTDGPNEAVPIIERFTVNVHGEQTEFATHALNPHDLCGLKSITHYRSGMRVTLIPIKADIVQCRMELESTLARYDRRHVIQRFREPVTLNPAVSTNPKEEDMSLEEALNKNTAAVAELTAALLQHIANNPGKAAAAADPAPADKPAKEKAAAKEKPAAAPKEEKPKEEVKAELSLETDIKPLAIKVSTDKGRDILVALLQRMGCKVGKTSELAAAQYAEFMDLANKTLSGEYNPVASDSADDEV